MPKMKTNPGAKKRFRTTATGKIKRSRAFGNHILTKKSPGRKRRLGSGTMVDSADESRINRLLPYGASK